MSKIHLIMPMAGRGSRFSEVGFNVPKPLIEIYGKPFFYWATQSISKFNDLASLTYIVLKEHVIKYQIDQKIKEYYPNAEIISLEDVTSGAIMTCSEGISQIDDNLPLVFNDCDHLFKSSVFNDFCKNVSYSSVAGILLTFKSNNSAYSYVGYDEGGNVTVTAEKCVISNDAICGCYYFASKEIFLKAKEEYMLNCQYNEYFISGAYNVLIEHGCCVKNMDTDFHISFGTPEEYLLAKNSMLYKEVL